MNCQQVKQLTDDYRDGDLLGPQAEALEQHLADCPACEAAWRRESAWLSVLGEKTPISGGPSAEQFTMQAVRQWSRQHQPSVLARIGRLTAAAAVVALLLSLAAVFVIQGAGDTSAKPTPVAVQPRAEGSPIAVLMADAWRGARAPRRAIHQTAAFMDFSQFTGAITDEEPRQPRRD